MQQLRESFVFCMGAGLCIALILSGCGGGGNGDGNGGGTIQVEDYQRELEAAAACEPGDTCVIAGGIQCACASPINQDAVDDLIQAFGNRCIPDPDHIRHFNVRAVEAARLR